MKTGQFDALVWLEETRAVKRLAPKRQGLFVNLKTVGASMDAGLICARHVPEPLTDDSKQIQGLEATIS